jgi:hypothetical protein
MTESGRKALVLRDCPQAIGLKRCKKRETFQNHRSCGHVDDTGSWLVKPCATVKNGLGTGGAVIPRLGPPPALGEVVPRPSTARPHGCPQPDEGAAAGGSDLKATRTVIVRSVSPDPEEEVRLEGIRCPMPDGLGRRGEGVEPLTEGASKPLTAALTPGFTGPYYRSFGAIFAPDLSLPSTLTGLRESFA